MASRLPHLCDLHLLIVSDVDLVPPQKPSGRVAWPVRTPRLRVYIGELFARSLRGMGPPPSLAHPVFLRKRDGLSTSPGYVSNRTVFFLLYSHADRSWKLVCHEFLSFRVRHETTSTKAPLFLQNESLQVPAPLSRWRRDNGNPRQLRWLYDARLPSLERRTVFSFRMIPLLHPVTRRRPPLLSPPRPKVLIHFFCFEATSRIVTLAVSDPLSCRTFNPTKKRPDPPAEFK